jgi:5-methyltetrahydropteroyltriglutamate--homocysteine methyltransferase
MPVTSSNLGFPRMSANRELKKLVENYWSNKIDESALLAGAKVIWFAAWPSTLC